MGRGTSVENKDRQDRVELLQLIYDDVIALRNGLSIVTSGNERSIIDSNNVIIDKSSSGAILPIDNVIAVYNDAIGSNGLYDGISLYDYNKNPIIICSGCNLLTVAKGKLVILSGGISRTFIIFSQDCTSKKLEIYDSLVGSIDDLHAVKIKDHKMAVITKRKGLMHNMHSCTIDVLIKYVKLHLYASGKLTWCCDETVIGLISTHLKVISYDAEDITYRVIGSIIRGIKSESIEYF